MNLEGTKLLRAIEDEFQIVITDEEAKRCETPRLLAELLYSKLRKSTDESGPSEHGFYIVRKSLMENFGLSRDAIRPDTPFENIFGKKNRKKNWAMLVYSVTTRKKVYKPIDRPRWLMISIYLAMPLVVFPSVYIGTDKNFELTAFYSVFLFFFILLLTVPFKKEFPKQFQKVGDLAKVAGTLDTKVWTEEEVCERVKKLIKVSKCNPL